MTLPPLSLILCLVLVCSSFTPLAIAAEEPSRPLQYVDVEVKPTPKKPVKVRFPATVRKKGETAEIVLRFVVMRDGSVQKVIIVKFSHPDMIEPALLAYENARYNPGMKDGRAVDTQMEVTETYPSK